MTAEQKEMVLRNQGLIGLAIKRLNLQYNQEEFSSIGMIGLCKGVLKFDKSKGFKESSYLYKSIFNAMSMYIRSQNTSNRGRDFQTISLDYEFDNGSDVKLTLEDMLKDERVDIEEQLENTELSNALQQKIEVLNEREKFIIKNLYGIDCEKKTQRDISKILNISQSYVQRIKEKSLKKLREELKDYV